MGALVGVDAPGAGPERGHAVRAGGVRVAAVEHDVGADELPRCLVRGHGQVHGHVIAAREDGGAAGQRRARAHEAARHLGGAQREVAVIHALVLVGGRQLGQREDLQRDVAQLGHGEAAGGDVLQVDALVLAKPVCEVVLLGGDGVDQGHENGELGQAGHPAQPGEHQVQLVLCHPTEDEGKGAEAADHGAEVPHVPVDVCQPQLQPADGEAGELVHRASE